MSFTSRIAFSLATAFLCSLTICGCSQSPEETPSISVSIKTASVTTPLTPEEVADFLQIVSVLPDQSVPPFLAQPTSLPHGDSGVREYVRSLQHHFRTQLDFRSQADAWAHDPHYSAAFQQIGVEPEAFCSLVSRVSCAWSARSIGQKLPINVTRHRLQSELQELMLSLENSATPLTQFERDQLQRGIQETVALSEFIVLMDAIPTESIQAVDQFGPQLSDILPDSTSVAAFEKRFESTARIMQVGHTSQP